MEAGDEGGDAADQGKEVLQRQFSQEDPSQLAVLQKVPNALIDEEKADLLCGSLHHRKGKTQLGGDVGHRKNEKTGNNRAPPGEFPSQQGIALDGAHRHHHARHRRHISQFVEDYDAGHANQGAQKRSHSTCNHIVTRILPFQIHVVPSLSVIDCAGPGLPSQRPRCRR